MNSRILPFALSLSLLAVSALAMADEKVSFGTGGYANQIRTPEMMHKIDTNGDGMVSKEEWDAFQKKVFAMIDLDHSGTIDKNEFLHAHRNDVVSFGTGGYATALRTSEMFDKLDTDHDGTISLDEFLAYHDKLFNMMDTGKTGMLDQNQFFGRGPAH